MVEPLARDEEEHKRESKWFHQLGGKGDVRQSLEGCSALFIVMRHCIIDAEELEHNNDGSEGVH